MKRILLPEVVIFLVCSLLLVAAQRASAHSPISTGKAATASVCGQLTSDATWTAANSPYDVCPQGVTVMPGVTLTIEPGTSVQFQAAPTNKLNVQGSLVALGSPTQPITLTGAAASAGSWGGLNVDGSQQAPARLNLDHVNLYYGGVSGSYGAGIYADRAVITVTNSLMQDSAGNGVYATYQAGLNLQNDSFIHNQQNAVQLIEPSGDLNLSGLRASQNGTDAVRLSNAITMHGQRTWHNPGIPYIVDFSVSNAYGDVLTLEKGSTLEFTANSLMSISGELIALGTPSEPITLTGTAQTPGAWRGLYVTGGAGTAVAQLDYVTIAYGGSDAGGANIEVSNGSLIAHHTIIRDSAKDGVRFDYSATGSMLAGQIAGNTLYGVRNMQPTNPVLASNNWWGDANGPQADTPGCSTGSGNPVSTGVLFRPVLTASDASVPYPLSNSPSISLTPQRWYAPADGLTRVYFDLTLVDGDGMPLAGRTLRLSTTLGAVVDGGVTDLNSKTRAYLTSTTPGDAQVTARLDPNAANSCEAALAPTSTVTFTPTPNLTELFPNSPAPYLSNDISVSPLPVIAGVPTTVRALLTNPLSSSITVDVSFEYAQAGVGLAFGPISTLTGQVVPAKSSKPLLASFVPPISGHYCVQVIYSITAVGGIKLKQPLDGSSSGMKQFNWDAKPAPPLPPETKDSLNKADKAFNAVSKLPSGPTQIQKGLLAQWWGAIKQGATKISQNLGFDPPRQDYTTPTMPVWHPFTPVQVGGNISAQRAAALNAVSDALADIEAYGTAATTALDRYGGASAANDLTWSSMQSNEMLYYEQQLGSALLTYADKLDAFVGVLQAEGETQTAVTTSDVIAYQTRLATSGFTAQEIADAHQVGLTDDEIETWRQEIIATNPADIAGDLISIYTSEAATARDTGNAILHPTMFNPGFSVSGGAGLMATATTGNRMAQVYNTRETIQVSNPLTSTATIDLRVRRIDLPADWSVSVSPGQVTLAPGQVVTATVSILAGTPLPQGRKPSVAVEGYAGSQLLGGVVVEVVVPDYMPFDGTLKAYLPFTHK